MAGLEQLKHSSLVPELYGEDCVFDAISRYVLSFQTEKY